MTITTFLAATDAAAVPWPHPLPGPAVIVRGDAASAQAAGRQLLARLAAQDATRSLVVTPPAATWPFRRDLGLPVDVTDDAVVWAPDLHEAFVNAQTNATRLVTTQPLYLWREWQHRLEGTHVTVVATASADILAAQASEALAGRGPFAAVAWIDAPPSSTPAAAAPALPPIAEAFRTSSPASRLAGVGRTLDADRSVPHLLAMASVCMEVNDLENAGALLDEAAHADEAWGAVAFEQGKYWLRRDDMAAAAAAFTRATRLLPGFASAPANLGAVLGELDRTDEAMAAFRAALDADPGNPQVHNNLGVLLRETGRLSDAEAAFRRVIEATPDMAFGHYNLGHTLFLQGRYQAALAAYQAGQRLDAARSPVQASRLALARLATGDAAGALRDLQGCTANLPRDYRRQLIADTQSVAWALLSAMPELRDWRVVGDWLAAELAKG